MTFNQKIYVSIAAIIVTALGIVAFLIYSNFLAIQKSSLELAQEKEKLIVLNEVKEARVKAEQLFKVYQQDFEKLQELFVDPGVPLELIKFLETAASNSAVQLKISSLTKIPQKKDPWPSLLVTLSMTGSPSGFLEFLERVESAPYLTQITELKMGVDKASMNVKVFTK